MKTKRQTRSSEPIVKSVSVEVAVWILTALYDMAVSIDDILTYRASFGPVFHRAVDLAASDLREQQVRLILSQLIHRKMVVRDNEGLGLSERGRQRAQYYLVRNLRLPPSPVAWDGVWRIVIFDVPEDERFLRRIFRNKLKQLGFLQLQRSSWIYPYVCEDVLQKLVARLGIERWTVIIRAIKISHAADWQRRFDLLQ